uniref:Uncharacterized protein n=1 Tax=Arsenophonus nasoniae TaxID=638 RepID=D2U4Q8_9GAMM|nr:hypothetical protein ARN_36890 [Arsenophonus nasoniae]
MLIGFGGFYFTFVGLGTFSAFCFFSALGVTKALLFGFKVGLTTYSSVEIFEPRLPLIIRIGRFCSVIEYFCTSKFIYLTKYTINITPISLYQAFALNLKTNI